MVSNRRLLVNRLLLTVVIVGAALAASPDASAQGWFAGASAGATKQSDYSVGEGQPVDTRDDTDTGFRTYGGYLFQPNFGVVLSYVDLGTMRYDGPAWDGFTDELSADGVDVSFIAGFAPGSQKRFTLFGLVGVFRWTQDVHYVEQLDTVPGGVPYDYRDRGTSLSLGAGGEVALGKGAKWGFNFEYQRFMNVGDNNNSGHEYDRDLFSAGIDYRFGK